MTLIRVGGFTKTQQEEIKEKLIDGLNSVKRCREFGVLPGGGASLAHSSRILEHIPVSNDDQRAGVNLLREVCLDPIELLCKNAGLNGRYIAQTLVKEYFDPNFGYNLLSR
jgi:chaperonin GroEL